MLAASAATLPAGHVLLEPYLFDDISNGHFDSGGERHSGPYEHDLGSLTYMLYGLTDHLTAVSCRASCTTSRRAPPTARASVSAT